MRALHVIGRVLKAAGLGLAIVGLVLLDEEAERPEVASGDAPGDDDDGDVHVMPTYGRAHETSVRCWCHPVRDESEARVVVHREEN